ncbi:MAG TPA: transglycosylase domain-containing protein [Candidatus Saccharimonadales bacterium]|nr:transglycosylase domain-containing protein [Candidatus Saccharimonadales bacterium]
MSKTGRRGGRRSRASRNSFVTRSGNTIKINRSLSDRLKARKDMFARSRAARLATLPKSRVKRFFYRFRPKHLMAYWFSREGAIMALKVVGIGIVVMFIVLVGLFAYFRKDLPKLNDISGGNLGGSITYYDRTGTVVLWQDYDAVKRIPVPGNQISNYVKEATVAIEDKNFYHEGAFSVTGIIRASLHDAISSGSVQGGSTITQQVVKLNEDWTDNRTIARKVKELILAVDLEREYSKNDILTGYLNVAPYGGVDYGVQAASEDYFNEDASQLTLAQSAMLAAIPQSPSYYSPYSSPQYNPSVSENEFGRQALIDRKDYILAQMVKQHYITQTQATAAQQVHVLAEVHTQQTKYAGIKAPYFVLAAKQELENKYGAATVNRGGWKVTTTLNMTLQGDAEQAIANNAENADVHGADEEATVEEDVQTGQIMALVGGVNFNNPDYGQNNYAAGVLIPPGSSFKPYDYSTLINNNNNVGAGSVLYDSQGPLPGYPCTNTGLPPPTGDGNCLEDYDFIYPGPEPIRYALGGSRNVPAVKAMLEAVPNDTSPDHVDSINKVISTADAMIDNPYQHNAYNCYSNVELTQTTQCYSSSAIGDGAYLTLDDHVNGLSTIARGGVAIPRTFILSITDSSGKTISKFTQPKGTQVLKPDTAYIMNNMLSDPNASYLPGSCSAITCSQLSDGGFKFQRYNGWDIAIKTGTTNYGYDGLMTAWTTKYAVVSWIGNHTRNVPISESAEYVTEPVTRDLIQASLNGLKPVNWVQPSDIKVLPAYVLRKHIHYGDIEPSPSTDLYPSWYIQKAVSSASETVDKVSGLLANSCTPPLAKETEGGADVNDFSIDIFYPPGGTGSTTVPNATTSDNVHSCSDTMPSVTLTANECADLTQCQFTVTATQGTHPLAGGAYTTAPAGTISILVDGKTVQTIQIPSGVSPYSPTVTLPVNAGDTVTAQVIDSVLYSANGNTLTVQAAPTPPTTPSP